MFYESSFTENKGNTDKSENFEEGFDSVQGTLLLDLGDQRLDVFLCDDLLFRLLDRRLDWGLRGIVLVAFLIFKMTGVGVKFLGDFLVGKGLLGDRLLFGLFLGFLNEFRIFLYFLLDFH